MVKFLNWINYRSFCCVFSLQSGVILTIVVFMTIFLGMIIMSIYTLTVLEAWTLENLSGILLSYGHVIFVSMAVYCAFCGSYQENVKLMMVAGCLMIIAFLIYLVASLMSYIPGIYPYACVTHRCPDHIWMEDSYWRAYYFANKQYVFLQNEDVNANDVNKNSKTSQTAGSDCSTKNPRWRSVTNYIDVIRHLSKSRLRLKSVKKIEQSKLKKDYVCQTLKQEDTFLPSDQINLYKNSPIQYEKTKHIPSPNQICTYNSDKLNNNYKQLKLTEDTLKNKKSSAQRKKASDYTILENEKEYLISSTLNELGSCVKQMVLDYHKSSRNSEMPPFPLEGMVEISTTDKAREDVLVWTRPIVNITFPLAGLIVSIAFNILYLVFVGYSALTYIAFANELQNSDYEDEYEEWGKNNG